MSLREGRQHEHYSMDACPVRGCEWPYEDYPTAYAELQKFYDKIEAFDEPDDPAAVL